MPMAQGCMGYVMADRTDYTLQAARQTSGRHLQKLGNLRYIQVAIKVQLNLRRIFVSYVNK